jgi:hypothetical protein
VCSAGEGVRRGQTAKGANPWSRHRYGWHDPHVSGGKGRGEPSDEPVEQAPHISRVKRAASLAQPASDRLRASPTPERNLGDLMLPEWQKLFQAAVRQAALLDGMAQTGEHADGAMQPRHDLGIGGAQPRVLEEADTQPAAEGGPLAKRSRGWRGPVWPALDEPRHDIEHRGRIAHGAGQRPRHIEKPAIGQSKLAPHPSTRRLQAVELAECRRDANRTGTIGALRHGKHAGGDGSSRSSARTAGRVVRSPGIPRGRVNLGLGDGHRPKLAGAELADNDESCPSQRRHRVVVEGQRQVRHGPRAIAGLRPANDVEVLDAQRHPME